MGNPNNSSAGFAHLLAQSAARPPLATLPTSARSSSAETPPLLPTTLPSSRAQSAPGRRGPAHPAARDLSATVPSTSAQPQSAAYTPATSARSSTAEPPPLLPTS
eukprot:scaffold5237_cov116-Isochrysis_galbana.AAC.1